MNFGGTISINLQLLKECPFLDLKQFKKENLEIRPSQSNGILRPLTLRRDVTLRPNMVNKTENEFSLKQTLIRYFCKVTKPKIT